MLRYQRRCFLLRRVKIVLSPWRCQPTLYLASIAPKIAPNVASKKDQVYILLPKDTAMTRFQKLAIATTIATYILIAVGGFVRAAGAGLGCPDWPHCFDSWIPPTDVSQLPPHIDPARFNFTLAWIEYINRLVGVVIGLLITATAVYAWIDHRKHAAIFRYSIAAFLLVVFQGWLGGQVVKYELDPRFVTVHLFFALVIVALLLYAAFRSFYPGRPTLLSPERQRLVQALMAVLALSLVQVIIGALVRGGVDLAEKADPDLARALLIDQVGWTDHIHRILGLATLAAAWLLVPITRRLAPQLKALHRVAIVPALITTAQFIAGVGLAYLALPPVLQVIHIFGGSILIGVLILGLLQVRYMPAD
jgi:heme a synthase